MPYIPKEQRPWADPLATFPTVATAGKLNFAMTKLCLEHLRTKGLSYCTLNNIIGALECAKLEMYRRMVAPYEDIKIVENGDVYPDVAELRLKEKP